MILQNMVDTLKRERRPDPNLAQSTERSIMRHAKIVISTLNYCGSARMHQLKNSTAFVIIDEGKLYFFSKANIVANDRRDHLIV
jgi:hypothetical protein